jgi:hypothetical protein
VSAYKVTWYLAPSTCHSRGVNVVGYKAAASKLGYGPTDPGGATIEGREAVKSLSTIA